MASELKPTGRELAIHSQRNLPSSLLRKRCEERFARLLQKYDHEEGHPVEWALISESGRDNKMLLITVYGWHDAFPVRHRGDGNSDLEEEADEVIEDEKEKTKKGGKKGKKGDGKEDHDEKAKPLSEEEIAQMKEAIKEERKKKEDEAIFVMTETYKIANVLVDESIPNQKNTAAETDASATASKKEEKLLTESYNVVGLIMDSEVEWMCDDEQYEGYEDMTTYFDKDGYSMVDGVRFKDLIRDRKMKVKAEKLAAKRAKKVVKKARQKAGLAPELSDAEKEDSDAAAHKRDKTKAKRSRQRLTRERKAEEAQVIQEICEVATGEYIKQRMGEVSRSEGGEPKVLIIDPNTPEGAMAVAQAKKLGYPTFSAP